MSRYRLEPTPAQVERLKVHCAHARYVWNLAVEQQSWWTPYRGKPPTYFQQCRQLTEARAEFEWLRQGSQTVQQQALRDFNQGMANFFAGTHRLPTWRKAGRNEGFRQVGLKPGHVVKLSRKWAAVLVPKCGLVRFRLSRPVPEGVRSYRITCDRAGRWHVAFAAIPEPIRSPGTGEAVGIDRGVAVSAALSTGELLHAPRLSSTEAERLVRLQRKLIRAMPGSNRRGQVRVAIAKLKAKEADRRRDWIEKTSTRLALQFDEIRVEDLNVRAMTRSARGSAEVPGRGVAVKAGLNRSILASGWGALVRRIEQKAPGRVVRVKAAYTSQTCHACGHRAEESRKSQALFSCVACGHRDNADVNAARNIRDRSSTAAGRAVAARGRSGIPGRLNREPQPVAS